MPIKKTPTSYNDYARGIQSLKAEEQLRLLEMILASLKKTLRKKMVKHSIMELEGLGADIWQGIDAQEYVREERESWD